MREYIINIEFENWSNQLWFMNEDTPEINEKWNNAIEKIDSLKESSNNALSFQQNVIEYLQSLGFIRIQK